MRLKTYHLRPSCPALAPHSVIQKSKGVLGGGLNGDLGFGTSGTADLLENRAIKQNYPPDGKTRRAQTKG